MKGNKEQGDKREAVRMKHWGAEALAYSITLSQAQITVVIGLLCVTPIEKLLSGSAWEENPVNLVSLLCVKLLGVEFRS